MKRYYMHNIILIELWGREKRFLFFKIYRSGNRVITIEAKFNEKC